MTEEMVKLIAVLESIAASLGKIDASLDQLAGLKQQEHDDSADYENEWLEGGES